MFKKLTPPLSATILLLLANFSFTANHALAHHPFGGQTPSNFWQGFGSGLAHPVIGLDHFTFVIAVGLLSALKLSSGIFIPPAFIAATLAGTGIHLLSLDLPAPEIVIAASVFLFGILLARKESVSLIWLIVLAACAGIFHGYAYGEAIVGAEMTPLVAYLAGFAVIQLAFALLAFQVGKFVLHKFQDEPTLYLRFAGFTICGIGAAFLSGAILG